MFGIKGLSSETYGWGFAYLPLLQNLPSNGKT
jgi:hypothetical protein